jgi:hypothetical protein
MYNILVLAKTADTTVKSLSIYSYVVYAHY